jgi:hypothetical protein
MPLLELLPGKRIPRNQSPVCGKDFKAADADAENLAALNDLEKLSSTKEFLTPVPRP